MITETNFLFFDRFMRGGRIPARTGAVFALALCLLPTMPCLAGPVIYQTSFETSEGYTTNQDLVGQQGWVGVGSGGNGIVADFFSGQGQQAYIGFNPPLPGDATLFVYQPLNQNVAQAQFSVTTAIADSTNTNYDDFYWSVFNQQGDQLFTLDFDNYELALYYYLDDGNGRIASGLLFTNGIPYPLTMALDFANNRWSATFNGTTVATNQPITTVGSPLNLGDIDAAWVVYDTNAPGDNFMAFDNYRVTASVPPPRLDVLGLLGGAATLRLSGPTNLSFAIEASDNLVDWLPLRTNVTAGGYFDYVDNASIGLPRRFYRGRWVP